MDALPDVWISREDYRRWAAEQPRGRFERIDGRIVAMAPERVSHVRVKSAVWLALRDAIRAAGLPCEAIGDGVAIEVGDSDYEPDALVNCGERMVDDAIAAPNPVVVVEVLSPSTRGSDPGAKLAGYFLVPSVLHYLIVDAVKRVVIRHRRAEDEGAIDTMVLGSGTIRLDPPGFEVSVDDFYG